MWILSNNTPFAAERTWVRDQDGSEVWIVAVKASFIIQPDGTQTLASEQSEVSRIPKFRGELGLSSLICESDLLLTKDRSDVLVHGHAYCSMGQPVTRVNVRLKVANIDKTLCVRGDRRWQYGVQGLGLSSPEPFTRMPIVYELAFGGTDQLEPDPKNHGWEARNPVGKGFAVNRKHIVNKLAPNIEDPRSPYDSWKKGVPVGFGPIARHWSPRIKFAGTYDENWENTRKPLLPSDFDNKFYQCAPEDQQVDGFLKGGELVVLHGMTPDGELSFRLPKVSLEMTTYFYDDTVVQHDPVLHTLILYPDQRSFQMVWHSQLSCHHKVNKLKATQVALRKSDNILPDELESRMWIHE